MGSGRSEGQMGSAGVRRGHTGQGAKAVRHAGVNVRGARREH